MHTLTEEQPTASAASALKRAFVNGYLDHTGWCNAHDAGECSCGFDTFMTVEYEDERITLVFAPDTKVPA